MKRKVLCRTARITRRCGMRKTSVRIYIVLGQMADGY